MYPSIAMAMNISRDTKYATVLHVDGCPYTLEQIDAICKTIDLEKDQKKKAELTRQYEAMIAANTAYLDTLFGKLSCPDENCVDLCKQLFNMPDFAEMSGLFKEFYRE